MVVVWCIVDGGGWGYVLVLLSEKDDELLGSGGSGMVGVGTRESMI